MAAVNAARCVLITSPVKAELATDLRFGHPHTILIMPTRSLPPSPREISRAPFSSFLAPACFVTGCRPRLACSGSRDSSSSRYYLSPTRIRGLTSANFVLRDSFRLRVIISLLPSDLPTRPFVVRLASARFLVSFRRFRAYVSFVRRLAYLFVSFRSTQAPPRFHLAALRSFVSSLSSLSRRGRQCRLIGDHCRLSNLP